MENKAVKIIIACVVGVILIGSLLVPIINDANKDISTPFNNAISAAYVEKIEDLNDADITIVANGMEAEITVDGNTRTEHLQAGRNALVFSQNIYLRYDGSSGFCMLYNTGSADGASFTSTAPVTVVIKEGKITLTDSATENPVSVTVDLEGFLFIPNQNGDYQNVVAGASAVYFNDPSQIYYVGANGTYAYTGNGGNVSLLNTTADYTAGFATIASVNGQKDMFTAQLSNMQVTFGSTTLTPAFFVIPNVVYGHSDTEMQAVTLLYVIPVMLLVALVVMAVSMFRAKY